MFCEQNLNTIILNPTRTDDPPTKLYYICQFNDIIAFVVNACKQLSTTDSPISIVNYIKQ